MTARWMAQQQFDAGRPPMAWRIDTWPDVDGEPIEPKDTVIEGPSSAPQDLLDRLARGEGRKFRLKDDDGNVYCEGRIIYADPEEEGGEYDFAPLDDYGEGGLGCTEIQYREKTEAGGTAWTTL